jgi:hypothetical protein
MPRADRGEPRDEQRRSGAGAWEQHGRMSIPYAARGNAPEYVIWRAGRYACPA